eukprot:360947-Chlamydomonas_euryale.AAC.4
MTPYHIRCLLSPAWHRYTESTSCTTEACVLRQRGWQTWAGMPPSEKGGHAATVARAGMPPSEKGGHAANREGRACRYCSQGGHAAK